MPQNAPTVQSVSADPKFKSLPPEAQVKVLSQVDPKFAALPADAQQTVMKRLALGPQGQDLTAQMQAIPTGDVLKQAAREGLPYAGATAASLVAGPEAGVAARMGLAALGGASGSVASHAIPGGNQPPLLSGAGAMDVGADAVKQATIELGGVLMGKGIGGIIGRFTSRVPVEEAAAKIADTFHPQLTPAEFGDTLRQTLETTRKALGEQKAQVLDGIASKFQGPASFQNTMPVLRDSIAELERQKKLVPSLFQAGQPKARTLGVLNDLQDSILNGNFQQPGRAALRDMDELRSNLFQMGQGMDRSLPKSIVGKLTHAVHDDIGVTLSQFGPEGDAAFKQFEDASSTFRKVADTLNTSTFKRILNDNINQPEKVFNILMQAPETNIGDLATIIQHAPNGVDIMQSVQHLALEKAASSTKLLESIPEPARQAVFGNKLPQVEQFFDLVQGAKPGMSMLSQAAIRAGGVLGGGAIGTELGHPMLGIGTGEAISRWLIHSGTETATISSTQLAALLGNSTTRQILMRAAQTPVAGKASALIMRALGAYLEYPEPKGTPTPFPQQQAGASIGDQLKSKGIPLPAISPNTPGQPFHPGAGL